MDDTGLKLGFCKPTTGSVPVAENELITDTKTLDLLGVPNQIGATVPLKYTVKGEQKQKDFILSGYWESDPIFNVGMIVVSHNYVLAHEQELKNTYAMDTQMTGSTNCYILFKNSLNLEDKLNKIITQSGYTVATKNLAASDVTIECNINPAYLSSNYSATDPATVIATVTASLLIIFTGYLIIYNIFQISVLQDIRFYALLKTIGTTSKQIKAIIRKQAQLLSIIGIPIGLLIGFFIGKALLPMIVGISAYDSNSATVSINPVIFIGAALFSMLTIYISTRKPGKIASKVSPIEALHYNDNTKIRKKFKNATSGGKLQKMAQANLGRNKKRTVIVVISMTLSLVLLNTVFTIVNGFDIDKYVAKFVDTDYLIGHANYFNQNRFRSAEDALSESFIAAVQQQQGFEQGGKLYYNVNVGNCSIDRINPNELNLHGYPVNKARDGKPMLDLYGLDDLPLSRLEVIDGELDIDKLKTGKYIIEGVKSGDHNEIYWENSHYAIGDQITINVDGKTYQYELLAKVRYKHYTETNRVFGNFTLYLPTHEYLKIVSEPVVMSYAFNVSDDKEAEMEAFIKDYTTNIESLMDYSSKRIYIKEFKSMQTMFITVGSILCFIIGFIGVLNFTNSTLTSILSRKRELAMLQSIGMTGKQLTKMLCYEGLYYAGFTIISSFVINILFSLLIVYGLVSKLWFFSYKFVLLPLLLTYPLLIVLAIVIPYISYKNISRQSIVERLRQLE
jgi:putative ABC transport system permease protein